MLRLQQAMAIMGLLQQPNLTIRSSRIIVIEAWLFYHPVQFVNYLVHSELLYDLQSAFCEGHFTESALIKLTNKILFTLDRDEVTGMIFVDFGKAF